MNGSWRDRIPFRQRIFFRGVFLLLAFATVALALSVLREEKQLSYRGYRDLFAKSVEQITARLQHPTGQLALLNPPPPGRRQESLQPMVLPFSAIDFDDKAKAQQAAEMSGCLVQYAQSAELCIAVGNNPRAGGFVYVVGAFASGPLVAHTVGDLNVAEAHRLAVQLMMRGQTYRWIAPLETSTRHRGSDVQGRLTGFSEDGRDRLARQPDKEFRGWLWQDADCLDSEQGVGVANLACTRRSFFSVRLPVELLREDLYRNSHAIWPPPDLSDVRVRVQVLPPGSAVPVFDSDHGRASRPFSLNDLRALLLSGEQLKIRKGMDARATQIITLTGEDTAQLPSPLLTRIIRRLPTDGYDQPLVAHSLVATPTGIFDIELTGNVRGVDWSLGVVAGRLWWFVAAMIAAIVLAWVAIELRIIRRITVLTTRAASVKKSVHASEGLVAHDFRDLRGRDELGLLAGVLSDLLHRVNEDVKRDRIRTDQEKDMWHAVGHEILAPLQSLMALHPESDDPSRHYIHRMQRAVRVLYGSASPGEAILTATVQVSTLDINGFLTRLACNAAHAGIERVQFRGVDRPLIVKADEYSLEDVITHLLTNADRYRPAGSPIEIVLGASSTAAEVVVRNGGPSIELALLDRIFEYGVSDAEDSAAQGNRGQGLFVAKTYMAKMGGTIDARNIEGGVEFVLGLALG